MVTVHSESQSASFMDKTGLGVAELSCQTEAKIMTDWKLISVKLKDALMKTEKWWEHKELLQHVEELLEQNNEGTPIKWLGLCVRIENALMRSGCNTIEKLQTLREDQILSIRGLGQSSIPDIKISLAKWNRLHIK